MMVGFKKSISWKLYPYVYVTGEMSCIVKQNGAVSSFSFHQILRKFNKLESMYRGCLTLKTRFVETGE